MSNFEQSMPGRLDNFPIGFPASCFECPSLVMAGMLDTWREHVATRNEVMDHNRNNPDNPAINMQIIFDLMLSSGSNEDFENSINDTDHLLKKSSDSVAQIDKSISRTEEDIFQHTSKCSGKKPGPVKVQLPQETGGLAMRFCSAELNNPEQASCKCGEPGCRLTNRISGTVVDQ